MSRAAILVADHPRESAGFMLGMAATAAIFINALFLQSGPHPSPWFGARPAETVMEKTPLAEIGPRPGVFAPALPNAMTPNRFQLPAAPAAAPRAATNVTASPAPRARAMIVADLQRELSRKGFYDGPADGVWGGQTDAALRDFAEASGARIAIEANEDTLRAVAAATVKASPKGATKADPIAELIAPPKRVQAVQRALADYGYGQIKPTGTFNPDTQRAIEKYERDHKMPVTGEISDRLVRSLAAMTGRTID